MTANWGLVFLVGVYSYNAGVKIGKNYFVFDSPSYFLDIFEFFVDIIGFTLWHAQCFACKALWSCTALCKARRCITNSPTPGSKRIFSKSKRRLQQWGSSSKAPLTYVNGAMGNSMWESQ